MPGVVLGSLLAAAVGTVLGVLLWRRRATSPLVSPLALMMFGGSEWAVAQAASWLASAAPLKIALTYAMFPGVGLVSASAFCYFVVLAGHGGVLTSRFLRLLAVEPVLLLLAVATDPLHHGFLTGAGYGPTGTFALVAGPLYWLHVAYTYALVLAGVVLAARAALHAVPGQRWLYGVAMVGTLVPVAGNIAFNTLGDADPVDLTSVLFLVSAALWLWVERNHRQFPLVPVSANEVVAALSDAVMVVDPGGRVLAFNPAATRLLAWGTGTGNVVGSHWRDVVAAELVPAFDGGDRQTIHLAGGSVVEVRVAPMHTRTGSLRGHVAVLRDVTELELLRSELAEQALRDALTGLHNRRHLEQVLEQVVGDSVSQGRPLTAVMVDVDHFKAVNDTRGHAVGDEVLVRVAELFAATVRTDDVAARFGGEEFVMLLPGATARVAQARAEAWRLQCRELRVMTPDGPIGVTMSCGVAELPPGGTGQELLHLADAAMYEAKLAGRDRVVVAGPPGAMPVTPGPVDAAEPETTMVG